MLFPLQNTSIPFIFQTQSILKSKLTTIAKKNALYTNHKIRKSNRSVNTVHSKNGKVTLHYINTDHSQKVTHHT